MRLTTKKFTILESVDSTNNYAMALVKKGLASSDEAVFSMEQTAGKGRRGKSWQSKMGENIILTIIAEMQWLPVQKQFQVSVAVAVGCVAFFSKYTKESIKIKWPNDIFINDRKAGGVLIENVIHGSLWQWAIIGVGININQSAFDPEIRNAVSLKQVTGKNYDAIKLSAELHKIILSKINELEKGNFTKLFEQYNEKLFCREKTVKLKKGNIVFETKIIGVSQSGELITKDAIERRFGFDEVEWVLSREL